MNLGETIKKLRRQKDITQETLAEYLNITTQAVSRWETGLSLPDITLIPALANIFDVSADTLLGIDIDSKDKRIQEILNHAMKSRTVGDFDKAVEILRGGLKEFPNGYKIMSNLMACIISTEVMVNTKPTDEVIKLINEMISLGEKILAECTDINCRHLATQLLCYAYSLPEAGKTEKAIELAEKMPNYYGTREVLLEWIYKGDKKFKQHQNNMLGNFYAIIESVNNGIFDSGYTIEEDIAVRKKTTVLFDIMFEDGNYGYFMHMMIYNYIETAISYAKLNDFNNAVEILRLSAEHAVKFDTEYDDANNIYTSVLFKGCRNYFYHHTKENDSMHQLEKMKNPAFDPIRQNADFIEIEEKLKIYAEKK